MTETELETEFFSFWNTAFVNILHKHTVCSELDIFTGKKEQWASCVSEPCQHSTKNIVYTGWLQKCKMSLNMTGKLLPIQTDRFTLQFILVKVILT
jgi:hypothetical protein